MKLGYAEETIDVLVPCQLAGYGVYREAVDYSNNLKVKVITFEENGQLTHIAVIDVLAVDKLIVDKVQSYFSNDQLLICATHTHSGPAGLWQLEGTVLNSCEYFLGQTKLAQIEQVVSATIKAINQSIQQLTNFSSQKFTQEISDVATNRNSPAKLGDNRCTAFKFLLDDHREVLFANFACHPTVLDASNTKLDADIVGEIANQCSESFDMVLFLNGSAGDISTRYTKNKSSKEEAQRLANILSKKLLDDKFYLPKEELSNIEFSQSTYTARLKKPKNLEILDKKIAENDNTFDLVALEADKNYTLYYEELSEIDVEINYLKIDELCFVALPLEFNSELSNKLKYEFSNVRFISYANGYLMYLAQEEAYDKNYYEASNTSFAKGEGENIVAHIQKELRK